MAHPLVSDVLLLNTTVDNDLNITTSHTGAYSSLVSDTHDYYSPTESFRYTIEEEGAIFGDENASTTLSENITSSTDNYTHLIPTSASPVSTDSSFTYTCLVYNFVVMFILFGIVCLFGIIGNTISQCVFWPRIHKNSTGLLLVTLAVCDNGLLLFQFFLNSVPAVCNLMEICDGYMRYFSPYLKAVGWPMVSVLQMASAWNIVLVTYYRYIAVCHPLHATQRTSVTSARKHIALIMIGTFIFYIPAFYKYRVIWTGDRYKEEQIPWTKTFSYFVYNVIIYYAIIYVIPFTMLIVMTYFLIKNLRETSKKREIMTRVKRDENDLTLTLVSVVLVFMICQLANPVRRLVMALTDPGQLGCGYFYFYLRTFTTCLVVLNSAVNFIIYSLCSRRFRRQFHNFFHCFNQVEPASQVTPAATNRF